MNTLFPVDKPTEKTLPRGGKLIVPGGMRVPSDFPYVPTKDNLIDKCEAAWSTSEGDGLPMNFRLVGPPGVGKNAAVYALAARRKQPLYIVLGNEELTAEDLVVLASLRANSQIEYVASPLLAAMLQGGICFIDEIAKMRPRALAPLASVLDQRRSIYSALLGESFAASPDFRFCAAYNATDADAFDLPPWLRRRTLPELQVSTPDWEALEKIVLSQDRSAGGLWNQVRQRLKQPDMKGVTIDAGTAIQLVTYARRLSAFASRPSSGNLGNVVELAIKHFLGPRNESYEDGEPR